MPATPARVAAGVRAGGQFAPSRLDEGAVALAGPDRYPLTGDVEAIEGNCWELPAGLDGGVALEVKEFPLDEVSWWATRPGDEQWCSCDQCPVEPTLMGQDEARSDTCEGQLIAHYAACMERGDEFPPLMVLHDPAGQPWGKTRHFLVDDGYHRVSAALLAGRTSVAADVYAADHDLARRALDEL